MDKEGTKRFDIELNKKLTDRFNTPIIASGGMEIMALFELIENTNIDAVYVASVLHYENSIKRLEMLV